MKLVEALRAIQSAPADARPLPLHVVCGFTPLHLLTFLSAHVQVIDKGRKVLCSSGLFGDCLGNLLRAAELEPAPEAAVVLLEWADFDPRLGLRSAGGWSPSDLPDILRSVRAQAVRLAAATAKLAERAPVRLALPSLPLPPVSHFPPGRAGAFELELQVIALELGAEVSRHPSAAVLSSQRLDRDSPLEQRRDVAAELNSGFPFSLAHASLLARALAELVVPAAPKKGLITDLDDTLWRGLVGEVGASGVSWDLDHKSHAHALYQQLLGSLSESGVLLAVASKNDPTPVGQALERDELAPLKKAFFPVEVSWHAKSEAVGRILQAWNIGADSVVFVDDNELELAEVSASWPGVTCLRFPTESDAKVYALLGRLRELFGKAAVSADDRLRSESIRDGQAFREQVASAAAAPDDFLAGLDAELTLSFAKRPLDPRGLELINKTNQFNLNGRRYTDGEWLAFIDRPDSFLATVGYKDKFGPLGTIAVVAGRGQPGSVALASWVLSCRAFSRRIEHATLCAVFERFEAESVELDFQPTAKNGPTLTFLRDICGVEPTGPLTLTRSMFDAACPPLYHRFKELPND